jgi:hypothetical protein
LNGSLAFRIAEAPETIASEAVVAMAVVSQILIARRWFFISVPPVLEVLLVVVMCTGRQPKAGSCASVCA